MNSENKLVSEIKNLSSNYKPCQSVRSSLQEKILMPIIGPFEVGKSAIMLELARRYPNFGYVKGFTTRPTRPGDNQMIYRFLKHDQETLRALIKELKAGSLVQVAVHPTNGYVYGSDLQSYSQKYNVLDVLTTAITDLNTVGYRQIIPIYIVCPVDDWLSRLGDRGSDWFNNDERRKRWAEAEISLEWAITHIDEIQLVNNRNNHLDTAAVSIFSMKHKTNQPNEELLQQILKDMLKEVKQQISQL